MEFESSSPLFQRDPRKLEEVNEMMQNKRCLIVIPTYNEANNIRQLIDEIAALRIQNLDILVMDDSSPDGTAEMVRESQKEHANLKLIVREKKGGLGSAYVSGFREALNHGYDFIFEMDADFSHDPKEIPNFLKAVQEYDLVIGSRYIQGVNVINWPLSRLILSYGANLYTRLITGLNVKDCTSGFKCFRRTVLEGIDLDRIFSDGYSFQIEINFKAWKKGFRIKEIPIVFVDRVIGTSKMSRKIIHEAIWEVWRLRFLDLVRKVE